PERGSAGSPNGREAYIVTGSHVWHTTDSAFNTTEGKVDYLNPKPLWVDITANLFQITHSFFTPFNEPNTPTDTQLRYLTSIVADWRYVIPNLPGDPAGSGAG